LSVEEESTEQAEKDGTNGKKSVEIPPNNFRLFRPFPSVPYSPLDFQAGNPSVAFNLSI